ncbi:hypothetical protein J6590_105638 [Homalodisca vitripennis]|nr:hypothetical protein J6590_105638 [Homalodisca vitripennis]
MLTVAPSTWEDISRTLRDVLQTTATSMEVARQRNTPKFTFQGTGHCLVIGCLPTLWADPYTGQCLTWNIVTVSPRNDRRSPANTVEVMFPCSRQPDVAILNAREKIRGIGFLHKKSEVMFSYSCQPKLPHLYLTLFPSKSLSYTSVSLYA